MPSHKVNPTGWKLMNRTCPRCGSYVTKYSRKCKCGAYLKSNNGKVTLAN